MWSKLRADFPITKKCIYLDHASGGPIPRPVSEQIALHNKELLLEADFAWFKWIKRREAVRQKVASFIQCEPEEVAFIHSTSQAMNFIAELLVSEGQVLTNTSEFPSSTLPWVWRKAGIVWQKPENGEINLETLQKFLNPSVKTILTSFVQYATGYRQDLKTLGKIKGNRYLVVNATQGFGSLDIRVKDWNIDFLCSNSYKWLMAGYGGGILMVRKKWISKLPGSIGWRSMKFPEAMDNRKIDLKADASRYEFGCPSFSTIFALGAAVDYLSQIGMGKIQKRILELTDFAIKGLEQRGFEILSPREEKYRSGIVLFKAKDPEKLRARLLSRRIYVSVRGGGVRLAPHFYNSFEDIEKFFKALPK